MVLDQIIKIKKVLDNTKSTAESDNTGSQSEPGTKEKTDRNSFSLPNPNEPELAEYAIYQTVGHHGTTKKRARSPVIRV